MQPPRESLMSERFRLYLKSRKSAMTTIADAAVGVGLPVFPCGPTKQPLTTHGFKDATTDEIKIRRMFTTAAVMIGVPTGALTRFIVVDVDRKENRQGGDWLDANGHRLPQTRTISTGGGGLHLYFNWPGQRVKNSNDKIAPGIDVRGDGGYVIVPPSQGYNVADDSPLADIPEWLFPSICPPEPVVAPQPQTVQVRASRPVTDGGTPYGLAALSDECDAITSAPFGSQETTLNSAGLKIGALVAGGELNESEALAALLSAARGMPSQPGRPAWSPMQLEQKARRAFEDGKREPRQAPEQLPEPIEDVHPAAEFLAKIRAKSAKQASQPLPVTADIMAVDGLLKILVDECGRTAIRPQPFLALGAAICAVGVLAGRQYRTKTDLRTNIYVAAIAESGGGKDHAPEIIRRCFDEAELERYLGGETIASGRAILTSVESHPAKLFQVDEFGMFLTGVTGKKAPPHRAEIWSELMKLFSRAKGIYRGTEYANKKDNPRIDIHQPCVGFYGTTTPLTFWSALEGGALADGSLARFLVFISDNNRPDRNRNAGIFKPTSELIAGLQAIARGQGDPPSGGNIPGGLHVAPMVATQSVEPYTVPTSPDADRLHDSKLEDEDTWARKVEGTPQAAIVNRLGENASKLALISAISRNPAHPVIEERDIAWGWAVSDHCARSLLQEADRNIADSEFESRMNKALNIIRKHGPCTTRQMFRRGFKLSERDKNEVLNTLLTNGVIVAHQSQHQGAGRPTVTYTVSASAINETSQSGDDNV